MNSRVVIERVAQQLKISPELVEKNYYAFWKQVKKELDNPTNLVLVVPYLGKFEINKIRLEKNIKHVSYKLNSLIDKGFTKTDNIADDYKQELNNLENLYQKKYGNSNDDKEGVI